jgi:hypothetical protein
MKYASILFLLLLLYCQSKKVESNIVDPDLKQLEWLIGTWEGKANNNPFYESWTKESDNELKNVNYTIINGDTTGTNFARIVASGDRVYYDNGYQIEATTLKDGRVVFEDQKEGKRYEFFQDDKGRWIAKLKNGNNFLEYELTKIK